MPRFLTMPGLAARMLALLIVPVLSLGAGAGEPLPWRLTPRWESSAGHRGEEWLIAFSRDGKLAFFDQPSGRIIARETTSWKKSGRLLVNEKETEARRSDVVVEGPDGRLRALSIDSDDPARRGWRDIVLEDTRTRTIRARARAVHRGQPQLLFSRDGKTLISATLDALIVWDVPGLARPRTLGPVNSDPRGSISRLVLSPNGETLGVSCNYFRSEDQIWDLESGKMKVALGGHTAQVWALAFSPDGKTLVSRGNDPQLKLWDAASGLNTR